MEWNSHSCARVGFEKGVEGLFLGPGMHCIALIGLVVDKQIVLKELIIVG